MSLRARLHSLLQSSSRLLKIDMEYAARSGFWINANFVTTSVLALVLSIAFANLLSKETFGTYQYLLSIFSLLSAFTLAGMNASVTHAVARGLDGTLRASVWPQLRWNSFPAAASLAIAGYYLFRGNLELGIGCALIAVAIPIYSTFNTYSAYLLGKQQFRRSYLYACLVNISYYALMFTGVYLLRDALLLLLINLGVNSALTAFAYYRIVRSVPPNAPTDPEAVPYAKKLTLAGALPIFANHADNILVFQFLGPANLAIYAIIRLVPERLGGAFKAMLAPVYPRLVQYDGPTVRQGLLRKSVLLGLFTFVMVGIYAALAQPLFSILYPGYAAYASLSILYAVTLLASVGTLGTTALIAQRRVRPLGLLNSVLPVVQLGLQVYGILVAGLLGAVLGKIAATVFSAIATILVARTTPR